MQNKTGSTAFSKFGNVFRVFNKSLEESLVTQTKQIPAKQTVSQFLCFSCDTYIEVQSGYGTLLVSTDPEKLPVEEFVMDKRIRIYPNVYFSFVALSPELVVQLYTQNHCQMDAIALPAPPEYRPVLPNIHIPEILRCRYRSCAPGYRFQGEPRQGFELTYVESGVLNTEVDGLSYELREKEIMLCGPGQHHSQYADHHSVSYLTIQFHMENTTPNLPENWYSILTDRVFPYSKKTDTQLKSLIQEVSAGAPYADSLLNCLLTEIILRLLQASYTSPHKSLSGTGRKDYRDELFERILTYIESKIYEPLTVANICQHFSLSRSTLQLLFKNTVNQSPKKFISDMKLEKSCQLLRESNYTISEISLKLGYSSIHYFSNAFSQKYHIPPSEYAKQII